MELTFSNEHNAGALAVFCKRVTFEDAYRRSDGETGKDREAMAYRILGALSDIETYLGQKGLSPR